MVGTFTFLQLSTNGITYHWLCCGLLFSSDFHLEHLIISNVMFLCLSTNGISIIDCVVGFYSFVSLFPSASDFCASVRLG